MLALALPLGLAACGARDKPDGSENSGNVLPPDELINVTSATTTCWKIADAEQTFKFTALISDYAGMDNASDFDKVKEKVKNFKDNGSCEEIECSGFSAYYYTTTYYADDCLANCNLDLGNGENVLACEFRLLGSYGKQDRDKTPEGVMDGFLSEPVLTELNRITKR